MRKDNPEDDDQELRFPRQGRKDEDIERQRRDAVINALSSNNDGLGFNELADHPEVKKVISRATLKDRLEQYEENDLIETPDNYRRGQKKQIILSEKGKYPSEIKSAYEALGRDVLAVWKDVLERYEDDEGNIDRQQVLKYVLTWRFRKDLRDTVVGSTAKEEYKESVINLELPEDAVPCVSRSPSIGEFYQTLAAELWKYYTEKIYGRAYIETLDKATQVRKDVLSDAYFYSIECRGKIHKEWEASSVPTYDGEIEQS